MLLMCLSVLIILVVPLVTPMPYGKRPATSAGAVNGPQRHSTASAQQSVGAEDGVSTGTAVSGDVYTSSALPSSTSSAKRRKGGVAPTQPCVCGESADYSSSSGDESGSESSAEDETITAERGQSSAPAKLWTTEQFPEGISKKGNNCDPANLHAAQQWHCPCKDRESCLSSDRVPIFPQLYEHRKAFQTTYQERGGKREALAANMKEHYSAENRCFSRSFVVGRVNDCCAAAYALACGVSYATFCNARHDVVLGDDKPSKSVRLKRRHEKRTVGHGAIDAYIRRHTHCTHTRHTVHTHGPGPRVAPNKQLGWQPQ